MAINPSHFHQWNVSDTCAIWNLLSSLLLYRTSRSAGCRFCCTTFVRYECLYKQRSKHSVEDDTLCARLRAEYDRKSIIAYNLDVEDLQDVAILENRKRLSKGELSSLVFAMKTRQAFLTDDQKARKLAATVLEAGKVQTTPHLFGWLFFAGKLTDSDKDKVISEHTQFNRPLKRHFEEMYMEALRCRLVQHSPARESGEVRNASESTDQEL